MTNKSKHTGLGIALGAALGAALGVAAGHLAIWLSVGVAIRNGDRRLVPGQAKRMSGVCGDPSEA